MDVDSQLVTQRWQGSIDPHIDEVAVRRCGEAILGCYGGSSASKAYKNEDAALVWSPEDAAWTFATLVDAHSSAESAALVLDEVEANQLAISALLEAPSKDAFSRMRSLLDERFSSKAFRAKCEAVEGEASCVVVAHKATHLFWYSVGDCQVYLFHDDFARLGQFALNQRIYYEWIGRVNTFSEVVPSRTSGVRALRGGSNVIALVTDGLLECGDRRFQGGRALHDALTLPGLDGAVDLERNVRACLEHVDEQKGRDSATIVAWGAEGD